MHDAVIGLIYNRAREYNPVFGRFMQRDPMGYVDGMSLYQYVGSEPVGAVDWRGEARTHWWGKAISRVAKMKKHALHGKLIKELKVTGWIDADWHKGKHAPGVWKPVVKYNVGVQVNFLADPAFKRGKHGKPNTPSSADGYVDTTQANAPLPGDEAFASIWFTDVTFTVDANSYAHLVAAASYTLESDSSGSGTNGYGSGTDTGTAYGQITFYDPTNGASNDANHPYATDRASLASPAATNNADQGDLNLGYTFTNNTSAPVQYTVRLEGTAAVLEAVPEPASLALLGLGGLLLVGRRKRTA